MGGELVSPSQNWVWGSCLLQNFSFEGELPWRVLLASIIPTNKRVIIALQYINGIGPKMAAEIVNKVGIKLDRRVNQLTDQRSTDS